MSEAKDNVDNRLKCSQACGEAAAERIGVNTHALLWQKETYIEFAQTESTCVIGC